MYETFDKIVENLKINNADLSLIREGILAADIIHGTNPQKINTDKEVHALRLMCDSVYLYIYFKVSKEHPVISECHLTSEASNILVGKGGGEYSDADECKSVLKKMLELTASTEDYTRVADLLGEIKKTSIRGITKDSFKLVYLPRGMDNHGYTTCDKQHDLDWDYFVIMDELVRAFCGDDIGDIPHESLLLYKLSKVEKVIEIKSNAGVIYRPSRMLKTELKFDQYRRVFNDKADLTIESVKNMLEIIKNMN